MNYRIEDYKYLIFRKIWLSLIGRLKNNLLRVYYVKWSNNFGDLLNVDVLKYYGFTPVFAYPANADVVCIGTILGIVKNQFSGYVLGSGIDYSDAGNIVDESKILGLRGPMSKKSLGCCSKITIGDPGLLASKIYDINEEKSYLLGIIPHESETHDERLANFLKKYRDDVLYISPNAKRSKDVIRKICKCKNIVSSSLHGLIVATSFGIPSARIKINELDDKKDFKFHDYYLSIGEQLKTHFFTGAEKIESLIELCECPSSQRIALMQKELELMFFNFKHHYYGK